MLLIEGHSNHRGPAQDPSKASLSIPGIQIQEVANVEVGKQLINLSSRKQPLPPPRPDTHTHTLTAASQHRWMAGSGMTSAPDPCPGGVLSFKLHFHLKDKI